MESSVPCSACGAALHVEGGQAQVCLACAYALALGRLDHEGLEAGAAGSAGRESLRTVGPYTLLEMIGEGGMGEVWLAEQSKPMRRMVALKLIKPGMDTKQVVSRFEAERQALALMDHAGIAKVLDGGSTEEGRPFFVMEHVPGLPITEHCDQFELTTAERIALFLRVCDGVQHAHQKAILHRDLKPGNILVSVQDGVVVPKIIDFGVAKAMEQSLTDRTVYTEIGVLLGTPEYMSPEQAEPIGRDVDTRADVYGLGVTLYELLCGALPFESKEVREAGPEAVRRMIREVDPPCPSVKLSTLDRERSTRIARCRRTDGPGIRRQLSGELDWITMKSMEKDRARRYGSVGELAADLARYLRHEPVLAGPPSAAYRARKFVRRNRTGVVLAGTAALAVIVFGVTMAVQAARVAREAEAKRRVSQFLTDLFEVSDPSEARGNTITARELLDRSAAGIQRTLGDDPGTKAELMATMGIVYRNLGLYRQARPLLEEALEANRRLRGADHPEALRLADETARVYLGEGRIEEAGVLVRESLDGKKRRLGAEHPGTLRTMSGLVAVLSAEGRHEDAAALGRQTLDLRQRVLGPDHPDTLRSMGDLAREHYKRGRYKDAEPLFRETLDVARRVLGPDHPEAFRSMNELVNLYVSDGRESEAEALIRESHELSRRVLGPEHPDTLRAKLLLARRFAVRSRFKESEALIRETIEIQKRVLGPENPETLESMFALGLGFHVQGFFQEAEAIFREIAEVRGRVLGPEHPDTLRAMAGVANVVRGQGRIEDAEELFRALFEVQKRVLGPEHPKTLYTSFDMVVTLAGLGRYEEAEARARETLEIQTRVLGPENVDTLVTTSGLATALSGQRRFSEAESLLRNLLDICSRRLGPDHPYALIWRVDLGRVCAAQGRYKGAEAIVHEVFEIRRRALGPAHPQTLDTLVELSRTAALGRDRSGALRYLREAIEEGYSDVKALQADRDLGFIRGDPEFERILAGARANQGRKSESR